MNPGFLLVLSILIQLILSGILQGLFPGFVYSDIYPYVQVPLSTFLSIFLPSRLYLSREKKKYFTDFCGGVKPGILIAVSAGIGFCTQFAGIAANLPINMLIQYLGGSISSKIPSSASGAAFAVSVICFALIPAVCEEILFRGIVFRYFRRYGNKAAVIISALLFSLMHFSLNNFAAPLLLGIVFGMMFSYTNRLIYSVIAHFAVNLTACVISMIPNYPILNDFYNDYFIVFIIVSLPALYYLLKYFKASAVCHDYADSDIINNTTETVYNIDEYNQIKVYEHDIRENNIPLAFKELYKSPYFYILILIYIYLGGSAIW